MINGDAIPGGHRVQLEQTAKHLKEIGVQVTICFKEETPVKPFDIVHGFGLPAWASRKFRVEGIPVVLSTIYPGRAFLLGQHIAVGSVDLWKWRLRSAAVLCSSALRGHAAAKCDQLLAPLNERRMALEAADLLLPNSQSEARQITAELGVTTPMHVVPNAVDDSIFSYDSRQERRTGVVCVGRFEPHKNQLGVIRALRGLDVPVAIIGPSHPHHSEYRRVCEREARGNVRVLPGIAHEALPEVYRSARVSVLASWFETTGLVSLEAALCGCNVVTTNRGYATEYFGEDAWYCDPAEPDSIRRAVKAALKAPDPIALQRRIVERYTWSHTARATLAGYERVCAVGRVKENR